MKKSRTVISTLLLLFYGILSAQSQVTEAWSQRYDGPDNGIDVLSALTLDAWGNVYVTGRSGGAGTGQDYATLKYSPAGQQMLALRYSNSSTSWDEANGIAVDASGNIYVTGTSLDAGIITIKYSALGDTLWLANFNRPNGAAGSDIKVDASHNVYVGGSVWNDDPGAEFAIIKYSADGTELWSTFISGDSSFGNGFVDLQVDNSGNIYVTGSTANQFIEDLYYSDILTVQLNAEGMEQWRQYYSGDTLTDDRPIGLRIDHRGDIVIGGASNQGEDDYVIIKYSSAGIEKWVRTYESPSFSEDIPAGFAIDSNDNIVITGYSWRGAQTFNYLTVKYDSSGNQRWVSEYNGPGDKRDFAGAIALDTYDDIYVTGGSRQGILGDIECLTVKYDVDGNQVWAISYSDSASSSNHGKAIAVDDTGNVYVAASSAGNTSGLDYLTIKYRQGITGVAGNTSIPVGYHLFQNYPNPFNPETVITYSLPAPDHVQLTIYDELGRSVRTLVNRNKSAGNHSVVWDGKNDRNQMVSSGIYFYILTVDKKMMGANKMLLIK